MGPSLLSRSAKRLKVALAQVAPTLEKSAKGPDLLGFDPCLAAFLRSPNSQSLVPPL